MTTFDPGARLVFTHGFDLRPFSTAFFARSPAAIITEGLEVLVQLVMAAITTEPSFRSMALPSDPTTIFHGSSPTHVRKYVFTSFTSIRPCVRFGPASDGPRRDTCP